ncbi:hypothetical protein ABT341_00100 [Pseudonocardia alni]|uniref:hypothetical protein n=1 Tax=Pseudonocardia alni TaxID=33907 RepID=UPI00331C0899
MTTNDRAARNRHERIMGRDPVERLLFVLGPTLVVLTGLQWLAHEWSPTAWNVPQLWMYPLGCCLFIAHVPYRWLRNRDDAYRRERLRAILASGGRATNDE